MFAKSVRFVLSVILSPRRVVLAALLATFLYAALLATKARLLPEPVVRAGKPVAAASTRTRGPGVAPGGTRTE